MRPYTLAGILFLLGGCASSPPRVRRLSPVFQTSQVPSQCKIVSVLQGSPAQKAGIQVNDLIQKVNGATPANAAAMADLVNNSTPEMAVELLTASGTVHQVTVHLNASRP